MFLKLEYSSLSYKFVTLCIFADETKPHSGASILQSQNAYSSLFSNPTPPTTKHPWTIADMLDNMGLAAFAQEIRFVY